MRDILGNTITESTLLWWITKQIPLRVARIEPGGILTARNGEDPTPDKLVLEITIPIQRMTNGSETQLADFVCARNPEAEAVIEKMLEGKRTQ
jgi:hypothetical protein